MFNYAISYLRPRSIILYLNFTATGGKLDVRKCQNWKHNLLGGNCFWIATLLVHGLASSGAAAQICREPAKAMARLELFFGAGPPRHPISGRAFSRFLASEVTQRFPQGLTLFDGYGQWLSPQGLVTKEHAKILLIYYEPDQDSEAKIEAIRKAYRVRFKQQSVLRADSASCVSF